VVTSLYETMRANPSPIVRWKPVWVKIDDVWIQGMAEAISLAASRGNPSATVEVTTEEPDLGVVAVLAKDVKGRVEDVDYLSNDDFVHLKGESLSMQSITQGLFERMMTNVLDVDVGVDEVYTKFFCSRGQWTNAAVLVDSFSDIA